MLHPRTYYVLNYFLISTLSVFFDMFIIPYNNGGNAAP